MRIRPLLITTAVRADVERLIAYAERERFTLAEMKTVYGAVLAKAGTKISDIPTAQSRAVGDDPGLSCVIPVGYRVVFSIEEQPAPLLWCRHLSVSVIGPMSEGCLPGVFAVEEISKLFGFRDGIKQVRGAVWREEERAINIVEAMEP